MRRQMKQGKYEHSQLEARRKDLERQGRLKKKDALLCLEEVAVASGDTEKMFQAELVKAKREMRSDHRTPHAIEEMDGKLSDVDDGRARTRLGRAVSHLEIMRKRPRTSQSMIIREFRENVAEELGADECTPWKYRDMRKHIQWGIMKSMQRVYLQQMEVIELLDAGKVRCAHAQPV